MKTQPRNVMLVWMTVTVAAAAMQAATPAEVVEKQFGPQLGKVRKTADPADDIELARAMLDQARREKPSAAVADVLCTEAWKLTRNLDGGRDTAIDAMDLLASRVPARRLDALENVLALQQTLLSKAQGPQQTAQAAAVVDTLLELADHYARTGEEAQARDHLQAADRLAESLPPFAAANVESAGRLLPHRLEAGKTARKLQKTLQNNPDDTATRRRLITLCIVELDDLQAARSLLRGDLDMTLRSYVPLAGRDPATVPAEVCSETAAWLEHLAASAPPLNQPALLNRARGFLNEYLKKHATDDDDRQAASQRLREIDERLAALGETSGSHHWARDVADLGIIASAEVSLAIANARQALLTTQQPDGSWPAEPVNTEDPPSAVWTTAITTYALVESGANPRDPRISRALQWLAQTPSEETIAVAVKCCLWQAVQQPLRGRYNAQLFSDTDRLLRSSADGSHGPRLDPENPTRGGDPFHTAYAQLGAACGKLGSAPVPEDYWRRGLVWWMRTKNPDGGWGRRSGEPSRHVETIAGAASVLLCLDHMGRSRDEALRNGGVQTAMRWVEAFYNNGKNTDPLHFLYAVARLGTALGSRQISESDWYAWASGDLLRHQNEEGMWAPRNKPPTASTALGLLVLCHARAGR